MTAPRAATGIKVGDTNVPIPGIKKAALDSVSVRQASGLPVAAVPTQAEALLHLLPGCKDALDAGLAV